MYTYALTNTGTPTPPPLPGPPPPPPPHHHDQGRQATHAQCILQCHTGSIKHRGNQTPARTAYMAVLVELISTCSGVSLGIAQPNEDDMLSTPLASLQKDQNTHHWDKSISKLVKRESSLRDFPGQCAQKPNTKHVLQSNYLEVEVEIHLQILETPREDPQRENIQCQDQSC